MTASSETGRNGQGIPDYFTWKIRALRREEREAVARRNWSMAAVLAEERARLQEIRSRLVSPSTRPFLSPRINR